MSIGAMAVAMGGNLRVGLEDSLWSGTGRLALSNAEQVLAARKLSEAWALRSPRPTRPARYFNLRARTKSASDRVKIEEGSGSDDVPGVEWGQRSANSCPRLDGVVYRRLLPTHAEVRAHEHNISYHLNFSRRHRENEVGGIREGEVFVLNQRISGPMIYAIYDLAVVGETLQAEFNNMLRRCHTTARKIKTLGPMNVSRLRRQIGAIQSSYFYPASKCHLAGHARCRRGTLRKRRLCQFRCGRRGAEVHAGRRRRGEEYSSRLVPRQFSRSALYSARGSQPHCVSVLAWRIGGHQYGSAGRLTADAVTRSKTGCRWPSAKKNWGSR